MLSHWVYAIAVSYKLGNYGGGDDDGDITLYLDVRRRVRILNIKITAIYVALLAFRTWGGRGGLCV